jgi:hypothetical protein
MSDFLEPLRQAHEEEYFQRQNQELVAKLRERLATEKAAAGIGEASGVTDEALLEHLAKLGVTRETVPVLRLMPLLQVAWADGEIQDEERALLLGAADDAQLDGKAREAFEAMIEKRPDPIYFEAALGFIRSLLLAMPEEQAEKAKGDLTSLSETIANATGGWFGIFGNKSSEEEGALAHISNRLNDRATPVLGKL